MNHKKLKIMPFKLLGKRVAVKKIKEEEGKTDSGLYIPSTAARVFEKATVCFIGDDVLEVQVGDTVLIGAGVGNAVTVEGVELHLFFVDRIEAIL